MDIDDLNRTETGLVDRASQCLEGKVIQTGVKRGAMYHLATIWNEAPSE